MGTLDQYLPIDPGIYAAWLTPAAALNRLESSNTTREFACAAFVARLRDGLCTAAAEAVVYGDGPLRETAAHRRIGGGTVWAPNWLRNPKSAFWSTGVLELEVERSPVNRTGGKRLVFHGVRFDPADIGAPQGESPAAGIPTDEYERWLTPRAALTLLGKYMDADVAVGSLLRMLFDGLLRSAARYTIIREPGKSAQRSDHAWLTANAWGHATLGDPDRPFWTTGTFDIVDVTNPNPLINRAFSFHGVRFDPDGVSEMVAAASPHPPPSPIRVSNAPPPIPGVRGPIVNAPSRSGGTVPPNAAVAVKPGASPATKPKRAPQGQKGPVTFPELQAWHVALAPEDQRRGVRWLYPEARKHFHPRRVPKALAEELVKGRRRGRPPKSEIMS
jgi:hypothetical protein